MTSGLPLSNGHFQSPSACLKGAKTGSGARLLPYLMSEPKSRRQWRVCSTCALESRADLHPQQGEVDWFGQQAASLVIIYCLLLGTYEEEGDGLSKDCQFSRNGLAATAGDGCNDG